MVNTKKITKNIHKKKWRGTQYDILEKKQTQKKVVLVELRKEKRHDKSKTNSTMAEISLLSVITLNVNEIKLPIER